MKTFYEYHTSSNFSMTKKDITDLKIIMLYFEDHCKYEVQAIAKHEDRFIARVKAESVSVTRIIDYEAQLEFADISAVVLTDSRIIAEYYNRSKANA